MAAVSLWPEVTSVFSVWAEFYLLTLSDWQVAPSCSSGSTPPLSQG